MCLALWTAFSFLLSRLRWLLPLWTLGYLDMWRVRTKFKQCMARLSMNSVSLVIRSDILKVGVLSAERCDQASRIHDNSALVTHLVSPDIGALT